MSAALADLRVLLVEDEVLIACMLQDMLTDLGCSVVGPAARVEEALALIDANAIDAAMLDVNLNGEFSYSIADALVARGVPFLFSTGYERDRVQDGYRGYTTLQKPFRGSELARALVSIVNPKPQTFVAA